MSWAATATNNVYQLVRKFMNLLTAFNMMRTGIRRNNDRAMLAGRQKLAPVMFIGKHHIYQRLLIRDIVVRQQQPTPIRQYVANTSAYTVSGDDTRGEGGDFILESKNKDTKSWLPPGVPSQAQWTHAARCTEQLEDLKTTVLDRYQVQGDLDDRVLSLQLSEDCVRAELRRLKYLATPFKDTDLLVSLDGEILHPSLVNFDVVAQKNYAVAKQRLVGSTECKMEKVFVTVDDAAAGKMTKAELCDNMKTMIDAIPAPHARAQWKKLLNKVKAKSKAEMLTLLEELEEQNAGKAGSDDPDVYNN
ncbi:hypothetical protein FJT64_021543 [Amphibalanus amphitrite]|uniref:Uncharacterized protein n=1 Tax=Amphibalanus amphitrite TaxID=1232801 RepID=A0A6A4WXB6_AMPAM|nr:hypothetical protein FJT64_021543 [Amphibalanus amphitrite]